ncbi:MAG: hypothetical protein H5U40_08540 [Polyangiaceae bacterium]|nr:hypothetical protein [Polyangiaceae bacterium]
MRQRRNRYGAPWALALLLGLSSAACSDDEASEEAEDISSTRIESHFPDSIGAFSAVGETRDGAAELRGRRLVSAERSYGSAGREATLRLVDVSREPALISSFGLSRDLAIDELDALTRPMRVGHQPAVLQWSRDTGESEVQVLVSSRYLVSLKIWPADRREEAAELLPRTIIDGLGRAR